MGCAKNNKVSVSLTPSLREKALTIFHNIDIKGTGTIDKEGTQQYWQSNFAKINTEALFEAVDFDKSGGITEDEWLAFWEIVRKSGYTEEEVSEELDSLLEKKAWVKFKRVDRFMKADEKRKNSYVKSIVDEERKKLTVVGNSKFQKSKTMQSDLEVVRQHGNSQHQS